MLKPNILVPIKKFICFLYPEQEVSFTGYAYYTLFLIKHNATCHMKLVMQKKNKMQNTVSRSLKNKRT